MTSKRALVLSGGGALGAFQVGALGPLAATCDGWDVVCGVSVGAINAAKLCQYPREAHRLGVEALERLWTTGIKDTSTIYRRWPWGLLDSLLSKGSLYNTSPLYALLVRELDVHRMRSSGVAFRAGAVALGSGAYQVVTEQNDNLDQWLMASSAFPGGFPPVAIGSELWIDGGLRNITPIASVVGSYDEIDVVVCQPIDGTVNPWPLEKASSVLNVGLRSAEVMAAEIAKGDFDEVQRQIRGKKLRIVVPRKPLAYDPLSFEQKPIEQMMALGRSCALSVVDGA